MQEQVFLLIMHITVRIYMEEIAFLHIKKFLKNIAINLVIGLKLIDAKVGDEKKYKEKKYSIYND